LCVFEIDIDANINPYKNSEEFQYVSIGNTGCNLSAASDAPIANKRKYSLKAGTLTTRPQRRSTFFYIKIINSMV
jgi:hypothetical protein